MILLEPLEVCLKITKNAILWDFLIEICTDAQKITWQKENILKPAFSTSKSDSNCHVTYQASRDIVNQSSIFFFKDISEAI